METTPHILGFSTSNYEAMKKFFLDFGFDVVENPYGDQLVPFFEGDRAARVKRADLEFNLEESSANGQEARFNLWLPNYSDEEIENLKALGYPCDFQASPYGEFYSFRMPDGGIFIV